jgi:hypothetical protein
MPKKRLPSNEILKQLFIEQKETCEQIANTYNVTLPVVRNKLIRIGLRQPNKKFDHRLHHLQISLEELKHLYIDEKMSLSQLVPICGIGTSNIRRHLKKLGIFRPMQYATISDEDLTMLIIEKNLTGHEIAHLYKIGTNKIYPRLDSLGLKGKHKRKPSHPYKLLVSTAELKRLYLEEKKSCVDLAKMYNVNPTIICTRLKGIIRPKNQRNKRTRKAVTATQGYPLTYMPSHPRAGVSGYVFTHVLVVEQQTGITPSKNQPIHHIDLDRKNNDAQNLYVCASTKEHLNYHHQFGHLVKDLFRENLICFVPHVGYCINPKVLNSKTTI